MSHPRSVHFPLPPCYSQRTCRSAIDPNMMAKDKKSTPAHVPTRVTKKAIRAAVVRNAISITRIWVAKLARGPFPVPEDAADEEDPPPPAIFFLKFL